MVIYEVNSSLMGTKMLRYGKLEEIILKLYKCGLIYDNCLFGSKQKALNFIEESKSEIINILKNDFDDIKFIVSKTYPDMITIKVNDKNNVFPGYHDYGTTKITIGVIQIISRKVL